MSKDLTVKQPNQMAEFNDEQVEILRKTLFKDYNDDEMRFAITVCNRTGLDPFSRQIYFQKRKNRKTNEDSIVITTGIDGFRLIATRSNAYAGSDEPVFVEEDGKPMPLKATVTVYRMVQGMRVGFTASVRWIEFYPGDGPDGAMWRKMPFGQLGKCAEAQALRKAFPAELSNIYAPEEMAQAANDATVVQTKAQQITQAMSDAPDLEIEIAEYEEEADFLTEAAAKPPESAGDYMVKVGKNKGKQIKSLSAKNLTDFALWFDEMNAKGEKMHADVAEYRMKIEQFFEEQSNDQSI